MLRPTKEKSTPIIKDFKKFLIGGDLVTVAVGLIMALVLAAFIKSLLADLLTPIVTMIVGKPNLSNLTFSINGSRFLYGDLINNPITFASRTKLLGGSPLGGFGVFGGSERGGDLRPLRRPAQRRAKTDFGAEPADTPQIEN